MAEVLFINDTYIKKYTSVNGSVDPNLLYPSILLAQDKYLEVYLGTNLMDKLKSDVENNTLAGNYLVLMDEYVRKCLLWFTMVEVIPYLTYKIDNGTLVQRTSEDTQSIDGGAMKDLISRNQINADYYRKRLVDYLCANSSLFPEYNTNNWPDISPISTQGPSAGYTFSTGNTATSRQGGYKRLDQIP